MVNLKPVIKYFRSQFPSLQQEDIDAVLEISRLTQFNCGQHLIRADERKMEIWFIVTGIVRAYYIKDNGQEMTPFFWAENEVTAPWESIYMNQPTKLNFEAVENTTMLSMDFIRFRKLVNKNSNIQRVYMEMMEQILTATLIQSQSLRNEKPEERYLHFLEESPALASRISQKLMASFLGITPISFSRMKKRMMDNYEL